MRAFLRAAVASTVLAAAPAFPAGEDDLQARVQAQLEEARTKAGFPGVTAAVALPDGRVLAAAAGWADPAHRVPLTVSSRMPAGSVGKTFVAAVVLQAVDEQLLDLDSPIERWIGVEPWFHRIPNAEALTLRLLLGHRSGIPEVLENDAFVKAVTSDLDRAWRPLDLLEFVFDKKPHAPAGVKFLYTDMNYTIAGVVFEHAVGKPLFEEIERRILKPQGLDQTLPQEHRDWRGVVPGFVDRKNPMLHGVKAPDGTTLRDGRFLYAIQAEYAGGGLISTSPDLARWAVQLWEGRVFSAARLRDMLDGKPAEEGSRYGLGVSIASSNAGPVYTHDGWTPGYQTQIVYFPELKLGAALQINSDPMKKYKLGPGACLGQVVSVVVHALR